MNSTVRTGQSPGPIDRDTFRQRFRDRIHEAVVQVEDEANGRLEAIAWDAYEQGRKSPLTAEADPGFADPDHDMWVERRETHDRLKTATDGSIVKTTNQGIPCYVPF
jgi:hypothetical protein